ncbi:formimidoylglutamate deiminase [Parasphingorhabdus pacifica]
MKTRTYWCDWAWLPHGPEPDVLIEIDEHGTFSRVAPLQDRPPAASHLPGMTLPGMANGHSHAFHRALRGRAGGRGTFWTWRDRMYEVAAKLNPDSYHRLATCVYTEMVRSGITCVGEFHYLHHAPGGARYRDPNVMSAALVQAARDAGIRLTLLDTCYLTGGFGQPVDGVQRRFADPDVHAWAERLARFAPDGAGTRLGAAVHSVRAVPPEAIPVVRDWAEHHDSPLHLHLSEQRAENDACLAAHGRTPTELLAEHGIPGPRTTAVHGTHLSAADVRLLGNSRTGVCLCPTTEADLADGISPATRLAEAGAVLSLGSDGHSVIDPFAELHAVEASMRLHTETRGNFSVDELMTMAACAGHRSLGWPDAGRIAIGARADLVGLDPESPRIAGVPPAAVPAVARGDDVRDVIVDGNHVVREGTHRCVPDVAVRLREVIADLF